MPREHGSRRFRRLGSASTAASAGALALVFLGAPAAYAGTASTTAAEQKCKKGTDPASTIENWKCQLGNLRERLTPKKPAATPKPTPSKKPPLKKGSGDDGSAKPPKSRSASGGSGGGGDTGTAPQTSSGATTLNTSTGVQRYPSSAPGTTPNLPGMLPTPQVAADPRAYQQTGAGAPQTRLVSSADATPPGDDSQIIWVAAAAGAAGAVGALNISVLGRRLRQRARS